MPIDAQISYLPANPG